MSWRPSGVFVANVTPFNDDGSLDMAGLAAHLEWLADAGVQGLVPCGTTGEAPTLSREERSVVLRAAVSVARARGLKVIAGCGGNDTRVVLELMREAAELGCDAALVVTPYYNKPTQAGLVAHYLALADRGALPVVLYHVPGRTAVTLAIETVATLFAHPRILGLKEASGQYGYWTRLTAELPLAEKALLAGDDDAVAVILALGGCGVISASANVAPRHFVRLYEAAASGDWERAFAIQKSLLPLVGAMFLETNPAPAKRALAMLGRGTGALRLPLVPVGGVTEAALSAVVAGLELEL